MIPFQYGESHQRLVGIGLRSFHASGIDLGRKSGTKFLEFPTRAPSKKQMKRRRLKLEEFAAKRDPVKEANTRRMIEKKVNSEAFDKLLKETEE